MMKRGVTLPIVSAAAGIAGALLASVAPGRGPDLEREVPPPTELRPLETARAVGALGRLEPLDGVIRVAGPARPSAVVARLLVEEGDRVEAGQPLAVLDAEAADAAGVARAEAEVASARAELARIERLFREKVTSAALRDDARRTLAVAEAELALARANHALDTVRAPVAGRVLLVLARAGERIGADGLIELGRTDVMYAVAEVYETDVAAVRPGQPAVVRSPAFSAPLRGHVERVGLEVRNQAVLADDPVAATDARVVEVHVRLDDGERAAALSNLQVDVVIETGAR